MSDRSSANNSEVEYTSSSDEYQPSSNNPCYSDSDYTSVNSATGKRKSTSGDTKTKRHKPSWVSTPKAKNRNGSRNRRRLSRVLPPLFVSPIHTCRSDQPDLSVDAEQQSSQSKEYLRRLEVKIDQLSEEIKKTRQESQTGFNEIKRMMNKGKQHIGQQSQKEIISVPVHIRSAVRDAHKCGMSEKNLKWVTKANGRALKSLSDEHKSMTDFIMVFVKGMYNSTEEGIIKAGIDRYFESVKQKHHKEQRGKEDVHKNKMKDYSKKKRKLAYRKAAIEKKYRMERGEEENS